jgi:hypothetical protein
MEWKPGPRSEIECDRIRKVIAAIILAPRCAPSVATMIIYFSKQFMYNLQHRLVVQMRRPVTVDGTSHMQGGLDADR